MTNPRVPVSVMVFTLNEAVNLPGCLESLAWCDDVIIVDSFSTDATKAISEKAGARFFEHAFEGFGSQRNWALDHTSPKHPWILVLDADERVPPELVAEMAERLPNAPDDVAAYRIKRRFHMWGRWLKHSSLYPTWVVRLFRYGRVRYENRGHAETQDVDGRIDVLEQDLIDENLKGIVEWFERQARYARKEAAFELAQEGAGEPTELMSADPLVRRAAWKRVAGKVPGRSLLYFGYSYVVRRGFLDGTDGLTFCAMKAIYQQMIVAAKHDLRRTEHGE
ncbi:MAG: glycosyltransferase family 2 protein [Polyangiales bacterium]|nr:glycosyltransferase family 2 protein [Myxococcales bacterium]